MLPLLFSLALVASAAQAQAREGYIERPAGVRLYYRLEGSGPDTIVYLHGGPGATLSEREIAGQAPLFARHTVLFYQQRGTGRSSVIDEDSLLTATQHIQDLEALRRAFGIERLILYGHSWGGGLAALYATTYPEHIARVIQLNPMPPRLNGIGQDVLRLRLTAEQRAEWVAAARAYDAHPDTASCLAFQRINVIIATAPGPNRDSMVADACRHPGPRTPEEEATARREGVVYRLALHSIPIAKFVAGLGRVTAPVLLLQGDADFLPFSGLLDYARGYPNAEYLVIPNGGHDLPSDNPGPVFEAIETFLSGSWPPEARPAR